MENYQFEVLDNELNKHKEEALQRDKEVRVEEVKKQKKYRLKKWVWVVLWTLLVAFMAVAAYQCFTYTKIYTTPVGSYQCNGKLIKICRGSKAVADYLGM